MKLKVGSYYRRRNGDVVGPVKASPAPGYWWVTGAQVVTEIGRYLDDETEHPQDLIQEVFVSDTPNALTDEQIVERFNELNFTGKTQWDAEKHEYVLFQPKPRTLKIAGIEFSKDDLKALKQAMEKV